MKKIKILVLGNDPQINQIDFERLSPNIVTLGLNRIWLKYIPNYFFFNDLVISNELSVNLESLASLKQNSTIFSSDWIRKGKTNNNSSIPKWTSVYPRENTFTFPDSATTSMQLIRRHYLKDMECTFYLAGISLTWQEPSHFWKDSNESFKNSVGPNWYLPRFEKMFSNFKLLKEKNYNIISVNPNSKLNKLFRYESIENLYQKS